MISQHQRDKGHLLLANVFCFFHSNTKIVLFQFERPTGLFMAGDERALCVVRFRRGEEHPSTSGGAINEMKRRIV